MCLQGGEQGITELVLKVLTDSFVWGTISNTLNIVGRSLIEARGPEAAFSKWRTEIQEVTVSEFKFFPIWNAVNFHLIPHQWRVSFGACGLLPHNHPSPLPQQPSAPPTFIQSLSLVSTLSACDRCAQAFWRKEETSSSCIPLVGYLPTFPLVVFSQLLHSGALIWNIYMSSVASRPTPQKEADFNTSSSLISSAMGPEGLRNGGGTDYVDAHAHLLTHVTAFRSLDETLECERIDS